MSDMKSPHVSSQIGRLSIHSPHVAQSPSECSAADTPPVMESVDSFMADVKREFLFQGAQPSGRGIVEGAERAEDVEVASCSLFTAFSSPSQPAALELLTEDSGMCISCPGNLGALQSLRPSAALMQKDMRESLDHHFSQEETRDCFAFSGAGFHHLKRCESVSVRKSPTPTLIRRSYSGPNDTTRALHTTPGDCSTSPERKKSRAISPVRAHTASDICAVSQSFSAAPQSTPIALIRRSYSGPDEPTEVLAGKLEAVQPAVLKNRSVSLSQHADDSILLAPMRRCVSTVQAGVSTSLEESEKKLECLKDRKTLQECISSETAAELLSGAPHLRALYDRVIFIDCRFEYEYAGGHIQVPPQLADWLQVVHIPPHQSQTAMDLFFHQGGPWPLPALCIGQDRVCAIFYCEFSQRRGPEMCKKVRGEDRRRVGNEQYPQLFYPEMYVLTNGYKSFWEKFPDLCEPRSYVAEQDPRFVQDCVRFNKARKSTGKPKVRQRAFCQDESPLFPRMSAEPSP